MVDNLHTHTDDIGVLEPVMKKFIDQQVAPSDLVSVMATKSGMGIYESFTSDKRQLRAAIDKALGCPAIIALRRPTMAMRHWAPIRSRSRPRMVFFFKSFITRWR